MIGTRLSHYRLIERIGAGGMGVVYRARDEHLDRDVAVKILPAGALADEPARRRFRREALALSKLNHPHVATIFDFDTQDGLDFLVMELVAGTPLDERLKHGALPEAEVIGLGTQIAEALEAAHEQGIVHRDLKPGNVVLTTKGQVKVLDFGLARLLHPGKGTDLTKSLTEAEVTVGTIPYMAPEQLLGRAVDARADLYSLGVVLFELATGRSPYKETIPTALVYEIMNQPISAPRAIAPQLSPRLETIIMNCLEKDPAQRYPSARALADDLRSSAPVVRFRRRGPSQVLIAGATLAAVGIVLVALDVGGLRGRLVGAERIQSLAVLPLENLSGDPQQEYFVDGMTEELTNELASLSGLKVISRTSAMRYKHARKTLPEIAKELKVNGIVEGSVALEGRQVRIRAQLFHALTEQPIWAESYEREISNVLALQTEVARAIASEIKAKLTPGDRVHLSRSRSVKPEAYEAYLRGRQSFSQEFSEAGFLKALGYYRRAIEIDPTYALAYTGIGEAYVGLTSTWMLPNEAMPKAREAAARALALDSTLSEAHTVLAYVQAFYDWDWNRGEATFKRAIEVNPNNSIAHQLYGYFLVLNRRFIESSAEFQRAHELDPLSQAISSMALWPLNFGRQYDRAIQAAQELLAKDSTALNAYVVLAQSYAQQGEYVKSLEALHKLRPATEDSTDPGVAVVYAKTGRLQEARRIVERARRNAEHSKTLSWAHLAVAYGELGDKDTAFELLNRDLEIRTEYVAYLNVNPAFDGLRSDPRFSVMLRRLGFAP